VDPAVKLRRIPPPRITSDNLLGGSHVAIAPGGAVENIKPGGEIQNTQGAVDLFSLIGQVIRPQSGGAESPASGAAASPAGAASVPAASD